MARIAIVTDSTADIPGDEAVRWGVRVVPAVLMMGGKTLADGRDFDRAELYRRLPAMDDLPTTAAPPPGEFARVFDEALAQGADAVLSIHLAQTLSGLFEMAVKAAQEFGQRVVVLDSRQTSLALGFQVLGVAEAATSGAGLQSLIALAADLRRRSRLAALVEHLRYLRRSGRVGWLRGTMGEALNLRLVIDVTDGRVRRLDQTRTRQRAEQSLMERVGKWGRLGRAAALHIADPAGASALAARIAPWCSSQPIIVEATTVIGTHVGPGAIGVAGIVE